MNKPASNLETATILHNDLQIKNLTLMILQNQLSLHPNSRKNDSWNAISQETLLSEESWQSWSQQNSFSRNSKHDLSVFSSMFITNTRVFVSNIFTNKTRRKDVNNFLNNSDGEIIHILDVDTWIAIYIERELPLRNINLCYIT